MPIHHDHGRPRPRRPLRAALLLAPLALALATGCGSSGSSRSSSSAATATPAASGDGSTAPDYAFYRGKTITYIVPNSPGSGASVPIVAMQHILESKLGATINISYNTAFTTVGQNIVGHSKPDGLTIGAAGITTDLQNMGTSGSSGQLSFDFTNASFIGSTVQSDFAAVACKGSPFTSAQQLLSGPTSASTLAINGAATGLYSHLFWSTWPAKPHKYINYSSATTQAAGCVRGDGNFTILPIANVLNTSGNAVVPGLKPLLLMAPITGGVPGGFLNQQVPKLSDFAGEHAPTSATGQRTIKLLEAAFTSESPQFATFGPPGIPAARLAALVDAFKYAAQQPSVEKAFLSSGSPKGWVPPADISSYVKSATPNAKFMASLKS